MEFKNLPLFRDYPSANEWADALVGQLENRQRILPPQLPVYFTGNVPASNQDGLIALIDGELNYCFDGEWFPMSTYDTLPRAIADIKTRYGDTVSITAKNRSLRAFGRNAFVDSTAYWTLMQQQDNTITKETLLTTNGITSIISDDASFTGVVEVYGYSISSGILTYVEQEVTLNGTTAVTLDTAIARCVDIKPKAGEGQSLASGKKIYIYEGGTVTAGVPDTAAETHCLIDDEYHHAQKAQSALSNTDYWIITYLFGGILRKSTGVANVRVKAGYVGDPLEVLYEFPVDTDGNPYQNALQNGAYLTIPKNHDWLMEAQVTSGTCEIIGGAFGQLASVQT